MQSLCLFLPFKITDNTLNCQKKMKLFFFIKKSSRKHFFLRIEPQIFIKKRAANIYKKNRAANIYKKIEPQTFIKESSRKHL